MLLTFDTAGRLVGSTAAPYPCPIDILERVKVDGQTVVDVPPFEPTYWHIVDGDLRIRPRLDWSLSERNLGNSHVVTIDGLPAGVTLSVTGDYAGELMTDGEKVELDFNQPGEYRIALSFDPYQPVVIPVRVTEKA